MTPRIFFLTPPPLYARAPLFLRPSTSRSTEACVFFAGLSPCSSRGAATKSLSFPEVKALMSCQEASG